MAITWAFPITRFRIFNGMPVFSPGRLNLSGSTTRSGGLISELKYGKDFITFMRLDFTAIFNNCNAEAHLLLAAKQQTVVKRLVGHLCY